MATATPVTAAPKRVLYIVGLRNYDALYSGTRHNVGASALIHLAKLYSAVWTSKGDSDVALLKDSVQLVLPRTFMNLSGRPVAKLFPKKEYANHDLIVAHDELELKLGQVKVKAGGSARGHNGVKSIIDCLGGLNSFPRVLIGIDRPASRDARAVSEHVLGKFTKSESEALELAFHNTCVAIEDLIQKRAV